MIGKVVDLILSAGNVKTEEESSLVGEAADLSSKLLPLGEKVRSTSCGVGRAIRG